MPLNNRVVEIKKLKSCLHIMLDNGKGAGFVSLIVPGNIPLLSLPRTKRMIFLFFSVLINVSK